jgi:hypothetical protein
LPNGAVENRANIDLVKSEFYVIRFALAGQNGRAVFSRSRMAGMGLEIACAPQPKGRVETRGNFFYFFARIPLKNLNSKK